MGGWEWGCSHFKSAEKRFCVILILMKKKLFWIVLMVLGISVVVIALWIRINFRPPYSLSSLSCPKYINRMPREVSPGYKEPSTNLAPTLSEWLYAKGFCPGTITVW